MNLKNKYGFATTIETGSLNITGEETNRLLLLQALFPNITLENIQL
jgi:hypothetical protein